MAIRILSLFCLLIFSCSGSRDEIFFYNAYTPGLSSPVSKTEDYIISNFNQEIITDLSEIAAVKRLLAGIESGTCNSFPKAVEPVLVAFLKIDGVKSKLTFDKFTLRIDGESYCVDSNLVNVFFRHSGNEFYFKNSCLCTRE